MTAEDVHGAEECLLQNQFVNEKLTAVEEEVSRTKQHGIREIRLLHKRLLSSVVRRKMYMEHSSHLRRMLAPLIGSDVSMLNSARATTAEGSTTEGSANGAKESDFRDLGAGCCASRDPTDTTTMIFKGIVTDLETCKERCLMMEHCGYIEHGWKGSDWCTVLRRGTDCSILDAGPEDCGSGGGDNGVHTFEVVTGSMSVTKTAAATSTNVTFPSIAEPQSVEDVASSTTFTTTSVVTMTAITTTFASAGDMADIGAGCCGERILDNMLFKGMVADLSACKAKCQKMKECGFIEYGWKGSKWCTVIPKGTDCSSLADGPEDCGSGGGDNGVHTYEMLSAKNPDPFSQEASIPVSDQALAPAPESDQSPAAQDQAESPDLDKGLNQAPAAVEEKEQASAASPEQSPEQTPTPEPWAPTEEPAAGPGQISSTPDQAPTLESAEVTNKSMDELIGAFIDSQSGSEDECHSQLMEAEHQLKQLHLLVIDLARQVNSTEDQIMVFDKELQEKLREISEISKWRDSELDKCHAQTEKAKEIFGKLKAELQEMHSIAGMSMDVADGSLHASSETKAQFSLAQIGEGVKPHNQHLSMTIDFSGANHKELGHHLTKLGRHVAPTHVDAHAPLTHKRHGELDKLSGLLGATRQASKSFQDCMDSVHSPQLSFAMLSLGKPNKTEEECEECRRNLQETYVKAYVELSRMKMEYEELVASTACSGSVEEQVKNQKTMAQDKADKLTDQISDKTEEMKSLRPRLQSAEASEVTLREQVKQLSKQCRELGPTMSSLDSVRDAIHALSACPGIKRVEFSLPQWTGTWVTFHQDSGSQNDAEQDKLMNFACNSNAEGSRAAEVGEIQEQTVQGIPKINSAPTPLLGACPECEGQRDETFQSGHSRVCWDPGAPLTMDSRRNNCGVGKKAILCIVDKSSTGQLPDGEQKEDVDFMKTTEEEQASELLSEATES